MALPRHPLAGSAPAIPTPRADRLAPTGTANPSAPIHELSARQLEVLELIAAGATKAEAAQRLGVAEQTVKSHVARILDALGTRNTAHTVAIAHCRGLLSREQRLPPNEDISLREQQVIAGVAFGLTDKQVGRSLGIAPATVKAHLRRIYAKLGVSRRAEAVDRAFRSGLLVVNRPTRPPQSSRPQIPRPPSLLRPPSPLREPYHG